MSARHLRSSDACVEQRSKKCLMSIVKGNGGFSVEDRCFSFETSYRQEAADGIGGTDQACLILDKLFQTTRPKGLRGRRKGF